MIGPELQACLSCDACRPSCSVSQALGWLQPLRLVRLASLGPMDALARLPEIWTCVGCRRCASACPMALDPAALVDRLREEAARRGLVDAGLLAAHDAATAALHRVRWHVTAACLAGGDGLDVAADWDRFAATPAPRPEAACAPARPPALAPAGVPADLGACLTCRECTTLCPVAGAADVYDPAALFRMASLGLEDELLRSPALWLCLSCGRCTDGCAQGVAGHLVIQALQDRALARGAVSADLRDRLAAPSRLVYARYAREIERALAR